MGNDLFKGFSKFNLRSIILSKILGIEFLSLTNLVKISVHHGYLIQREKSVALQELTRLLNWSKRLNLVPQELSYEQCFVPEKVDEAVTDSKPKPEPVFSKKICRIKKHFWDRISSRPPPFLFFCITLIFRPKSSQREPCHLLFRPITTGSDFWRNSEFFCCSGGETKLVGHAKQGPRFESRLLKKLFLGLRRKHWSN